MASSLWLRSFKLAVLVGVPVLAVLYSYQFTLVESEELQPFRSFPVPSSSLYKDNQRKLETLTFREPITVVNFWATWCPPCVSEFPSMIELQRLLEGKGVELVFISVDDSWDKVAQFQKDNVIEVRSDRQFWDPDKKAAEAWGSSRFPETYVVRKDGWVVEKIVGEQRWSRPVVVKYFEDLASSVVDELAFESWSDFIPKVYAQGIHGDDKKTLDQLKENIATATQNFMNSQAALKDEERNLQQQKTKVLKQQEELSTLNESRSQLINKKSELDSVKLKNESARRSELQERDVVVRDIKTNQELIVDLEAKLEAARVGLVEKQKSLSTRNQNLESLEQAKEALDEDLSKMKERLSSSDKTIREEERKLSEFKAEENARQKSVESLREKVRKSEQTLDAQKAKFVEFEKILSN